MGPDELKRNLELPCKSIRLFALERLLQERITPAIKRVLEEYHREETDEECRHFVELLLGSASGATPSPDAATNADGRETWIDSYRAASPADRSLRLRDLKNEDMRVLAPEALKLIREESSPILAAALTKRFGAFIPAGEPHPLLEFLESGFISVRLAALDILCQTAPARLIGVLPGLLASPDPVVRSLSIQGLFAIDPEEACRHLECHLLGQDPQTRQLLIRSCFQIPFAKVKGSVLKALRLEIDPERKKLLGLLVQTNPDQEVPFQLWLMAEEAGGEEALFYRNLLVETLKVIEISGILGSRFGEYRNNLQTWVNDRLARVLCLRILAEWNRAGERDEQALTALVQRARDNRRLGEAFARACQAHWPQDLADWYRRQCSGETTLRGHPVTADGFFTGEPSDQVRLLATWPQNDSGGIKPVLERLLAAERPVPEILAAGIRAAARFRQAGFAEACGKLLQHSNPLVVGSVLEYLAVFDPAALFSKLGPFLRSPVPRLKIQAIGLLRRFDLAEVLQRLGSLLGHRDPKQQELGLQCLFHVEFNLVRDLLAEYLRRCKDETLFRTGLALFQSNPDPGNPAYLLSLESVVDRAFRKEVESVRLECQEFLLGAGLWDPARKEEQEAVVKSEAKVRLDWIHRPRPAYAHPSNPVSPSPFEQARDVVRQIVEMMRGGRWLSAPALLLVAIVAYYLLFWTSPSASRKESSLLVAQPMKGAGTVTEVGKEWVTVIFEGEKRSFLFRKTEVPREMTALRTRVEMVYEPYRVYRDQIVYCKALSSKILAGEKK